MADLGATWNEVLEAAGAAQEAPRTLRAGKRRPGSLRGREFKLTSDRGGQLFDDRGGQLFG
jgi:hypothetical protein